MEKGMNLNLKIWRQKNTADKGQIVDYKISEVSPDMSFLEMIDVAPEREHQSGRCIEAARDEQFVVGEGGAHFGVSFFLSSAM